MTEAIIVALIGAAGVIVAAWLSSRKHHPPAVNPVAGFGARTSDCGQQRPE